MAGGRPTSYTKDMPEKLIEYFSSDENEREPLMPTLAGFAIEADVCRDTLHEWANTKDDNGKLKHPLFSDAYKRAKGFQEAKLVQGALGGGFNPAFSIFFSKNVLGWRDRQEITQDITAKVDVTGEITASDKLKDLLTGINKRTKPQE